MSPSESFDAFYGRTSWTVTSQMRALAGEDPLADHAIREAYAKAYQQWYEVSTYADPEGWVLGVAKDAYERRRAESTALTDAAPAAGADSQSWPGFFRPPRPPAEQLSDPDATLDPRPAGPAGLDAAGPAPADGGQLAGAAAIPTEVPPGSLFGSRSPGSSLAADGAAAGVLASGQARGGPGLGGSGLGGSGVDGATADWAAPAYGGPVPGGDGTPGWPGQVTSMPTATIGEPLAGATAGQPVYPGANRRPREVGPRLLRSRRNLIVVATAVAVLAAGGIYYALGGNKSAGGSTPPASTGPAAKPSVHMLAAGQTGGRLAIPWSLIGPGWTLAEFSNAQPTSTGSVTAGTNLTYLVDPKGGKYRIRTTSGAPLDLLAWSGNAKEALYGLGGGQSYGLLSLTSGQLTPLPLPAGVAALGFTRPDGLNILAVRQASARYRLERYNLAGAYQATIGAMPRPGGAPNVARANALSSPDGTTAVWGVSGAGMQLVSNSGGLIRKLRMLGTGAPKSCTPVSWWGADSVLAYCNAAGQPAAGRLWEAPIGGGTPTPLTGISGSATGGGALTGAWQADSGVYITSTTSAVCQGAPSGPGGQQILQLSGTGAETAVSIPNSTNNYASVVAAVGGRLLVLAQTSCPGTSSLIWFNPSTHGVQALLTAPSTESGVVGAVPYGSGPAALAG